MTDSGAETAGFSRALPLELWKPIGDWRIALVWRLYGWAGIQQALLLSGVGSLRAYFAQAPLAVHGMALCSLLLVLFGPRPLLLLVTSLLASWVFFLTAQGLDPVLHFPGAEQPLFWGMPVFTVVLWALGRWSRAGEEDRLAATLWAYRILFLTEMGLATLHKMNRDFFDPALSCATVLTEMVPQWWDTSVTMGAGLLTPPVVVGLELGSALLPVLYWPAGLLLGLTFFSGLASVGPTGFTAVTLAAAFAFVRGVSAREFYQPLRRWWWILAPAGVGLVVWVARAQRTPPGHPWPQFALYAIVAALLAFLVICEWLRRVSSRRSREPGARGGLAGPRSPSLRLCLLVLLVASIVNGLTPYFGYKYHFSFAMLSNLRADGSRWNSYVIPASFRMTAEEPFLEVVRLRIDAKGGAPRSAARGLERGFWAPDEFVRRVYRHRRRGHDVHAVVVYQGERRVLGRIGRNPETTAYLDRLPRAHLFQKGVVAGPQPCVH